MRDATEIATDQGRVFQFAITPIWEPRRPVYRKFRPVKLSLVSTSGGSFDWKEEEILRIQCEEDDKQMDFLQSSIGRVIAAKAKWPEVSTARYDELDGIHH